MKAEEMDVGSFYNFVEQTERLVYLGNNFSGNGYWHQFALVSEPTVAWCELQKMDLAMIELTPVVEVALVEGSDMAIKSCACLKLIGKTVSVAFGKYGAIHPVKITDVVIDQGVLKLQIYWEKCQQTQLLDMSIVKHVAGIDYSID